MTATAFRTKAAGMNLHWCFSENIPPTPSPGPRRRRRRPLMSRVLTDESLFGYRKNEFIT